MSTITRHPVGTRARTGEACPDGTFSIRKLAIEDKHGLRRNAYNAKVNIHRRDADPILLGIEDRLLREDTCYMTTTVQSETSSDA